MKTDDDYPEGTFPPLLRDLGLRVVDVAKATEQGYSNTWAAIHGLIPVRERGYMRKRSQLASLSRLLGLSPDRIKQISQATMAWYQAQKGQLPCHGEPISTATKPN